MLPFNSTKTLMFILNELHAISKIDPLIDINTTLNTKYQIFNEELPTIYPPKIQYFGIGVNGFRSTDSRDGFLPYKPDPRNMDLYHPIPIRVVPKDNDLEPEERDKYRIRVLKTINNEEYWCYYLKKLEILSTNSVKVKVNLLTGEEELFDIDYNYLNPVPQDIAVPNEEDDTEEYNVYIDTLLQLTGEELYNTINVMYNGNLQYGLVSEIGLYSGEDRIVTDDFGTSYIESIYTQLTCHECNLGMDLTNINTSVEKVIRITQSTGFVL